MNYLVNSYEMRKYDKNTTEYYHIPSIVLMERAAVAFTEELFRSAVDLSRVLVVCGSGNNGGDGLAIARLLKLAGVQTDLVFVGDRKRASEQNILQQDILAAYQFQIHTAISSGTSYTTVIDALFGVGIKRPVEGVCASVIEQMNRMGGCKIAVDIPSGVSADNGAIFGVAFRADRTITFAYEKLGMRLWPGVDYSGRICVKDIGIGEPSRMGETPAVAVIEDADLAFWNERKARSNKGTFGRLLVIAGSVGMAGASVLCVRAAYAAGAGLVHVYAPTENRSVLQTMAPEAVLTAYPSDAPDFSALLDAMRRATAIVCGPGLGMSESAKEIVEFVIQNTSVPLLLDADALNIAAENEIFPEHWNVRTVVTPHLGEMSRLTGREAADIKDHLIEVAETYAKQYNVICVLKDAHTITCVPNEQTYLNLSGNAGMATAGSGDVLSGVIASLMAQGMRAGEAAPFGVYVHGRAGDLAAEKFGMRSMNASDIIDGLRSFSINCSEQVFFSAERNESSNG